MSRRRNRNRIRMVKSFAIALLLHLSILLLFWVGTEHFSKPPAPKGEKKITLDLSQFVTPPPTPKPQMKPVPPPQPTTPPQPKKSVKEKPQPKKKALQEKKILTAQKAPEDNNITKNIKKPKKKIVKKMKRETKKVVKKKIVKKSPPKKPIKRPAQKRPPQKQYNSPLAKSLMNNKNARNMKTRSSQPSASPNTKRMINKLYGSEFDGYSSEQKKFIENNLMIIHRITQMTLNQKGYPEIAARTGQQGINIVSFDLHPNGNITNLRLDKHMGYEALDRNTLQVIRIAYKDYPLPRKKTKIKFFVQYSIDGY